MKEDLEEQQHELNSDTASADSHKRKLEDNILLAKQKAQEIAARLVSNAESKRPRLDDDSSEALPPSNSNSNSNSVSNPPFPVFFAAQAHAPQGSSRKISIPNGKVGLIIGKGGETIKYLQHQSGAKIQITKDSEADPYSLTRDVELTGTSEQISRAEQLINDVITQTDAGGSASSANHGFSSVQSGAEQFIMKVPNNKVALLIGKGGETIRNMQSKSGARIQIVPLHLPPGDTSTERNVHIDGQKEQIDAAKELVNEVISGKRLVNASGGNSYVQPAYTPPANWGTQVQPPMQQQQPQYDYTQSGSYITPPASASYYSGYPTQVAGWDQANQSTVSQPPQQSTGYGYYGQQDGYYGQQAQLGSTPQNPDYSYNQTLPNYSYDQSYSHQSANYGHNIPSQAAVLDQPKQNHSLGYGPPPVPSNLNGTSFSQTAQQSPGAHHHAHSQPMANPQAGYWTYPNSTNQPPSQAYNQTGYFQPSYGGDQQAQVPPASQSEYGEGGYPFQSAPEPAPASYVQETQHPDHEEPQLEQQSNRLDDTYPRATGDQKTSDGNLVEGSAPVVQETRSSPS
ncbi:uncharacterized protein LOC107411206 [Ziziphus jujuba]|uniref:Uncharacterized protein LOC107411206 n=1 Tax=Ziziphus jujuba TaxID=326968 RepID=A0A6P3ZKX6_ZIZJJ|nr:uncharacterized protein LOC107411206 [Ziziphus jujuba]